MEILKKLTPKTILGGKPEKPAQASDLFTIYGKATGVKTGESTYGPWAAILGQFEAVKADTGEVYFSTVAILPEPMNSAIVDRVKSGKDGEEVRFAFVIGIKPADTATGYEYTTKPLQEPTADDGLNDLRALAQKHVPALPAPTAADKDADKPASKPASGKKK